jgi:hypothetical protein
MRSLAQPGVLFRAGLAALVTSLACFSRLTDWTERSHSTLFLSLALFYVVFVLWAFVFAWQSQYAKMPVFLYPSLRTWAGATACGLVWGLLLYLAVDPQLRIISPKDYPSDLRSWVSMSLFTLGFYPLFLFFGPLAFFARLSQNRVASFVLTLLFGTFILLVKLGSSPVYPPMLLVATLMVLRLIEGLFSIYFYLRGGAVLVWWLVLLLQLRHLIGCFFAS